MSSSCLAQKTSSPTCHKRVLRPGFLPLTTAEGDDEEGEDGEAESGAGGEDGMVSGAIEGGADEKPAEAEDGATVACLARLLILPLAEDGCFLSTGISDR